MLEICKKLVAQALSAGADSADCIATATEGISADIYEGHVDEFQKSQTQGIGLRVLQNGRVGYAYTEQIEQAGQIVEKALASASVTDVDEYACIFEQAKTYVSEQPRQVALSPEISQKIVDKALSLYHAVMSQKHIENVQGCSAEMDRTFVYFANSAGTEGRASRQSAALFVDAVAKIESWTDSGWAFAVSQTLEDLDEYEVAQKAQQKAVQYYKAGRAENGLMPVIFHGQAMVDLLGAFAPVFSAERAQKGLSQLAGKQGQRIAADCVSLVDTPEHPLLGPGLPFDGEGVPTAPLTLIDRGVLKTLLYSLSSAKQDGVQSTGHGRRGYNSQVSIAPHVFTIQPGEQDFAALCQMAGSGVVIYEVSGLHAGVNDVSGDFSLLCKGRKIENGAEGEAVEQMVVSGNFFAMLLAVQAVGNDMQYSIPGGSCMASPSLFVGSLSIAGN